MLTVTQSLLYEALIEQMLRREIVGREVDGIRVVGAMISRPGYLGDENAFLVDLILSDPIDGSGMWPADATRQLRELTHDALSRTDVEADVEVETAGRPPDFQSGVTVW